MTYQLYSYEMVKEMYKVLPLKQLAIHLSLVEHMEDRCKNLDQRTSYNFNHHSRPEPDLYYMKDRIKIRLLELEKLQIRKSQ